MLLSCVPRLSCVFVMKLCFFAKLRLCPPSEEGNIQQFLESASQVFPPVLCLLVALPESLSSRTHLWVFITRQNGDRRSHSTCVWMFPGRDNGAPSSVRCSQNLCQILWTGSNTSTSFTPTLSALEPLPSLLPCVCMGVVVCVSVGACAAFRSGLWYPHVTFGICVPGPHWQICGVQICVDGSVCKVGSPLKVTMDIVGQPKTFLFFAA